MSYIVEAFVGQEILVYSDPFLKPSLFYWHRESRSSNAEIDYVINQEQAIIPLEVKSGNSSKLKSLHLFLDEHPNSTFGIIINEQMPQQRDNIRSIPLYMLAPFLTKEEK